MHRAHGEGEPRDRPVSLDVGTSLPVCSAVVRLWLESMECWGEDLTCLWGSNEGAKHPVGPLSLAWTEGRKCSHLPQSSSYYKSWWNLPSPTLVNGTQWYKLRHTSDHGPPTYGFVDWHISYLLCEESQFSLIMVEFGQGLVANSSMNSSWRPFLMSSLVF